MRKLLILFFVLSASFAKAQTTVSGNQYGVWLKSSSPYQVAGNITVPYGDTLFIEAGVTVTFTSYYKFTINGVLIAEGEVSDSVLFTPENRTTGWGGLRFENGSGVSILNYCRIEFGKTAATDYPDIHGGGAALINTDVQFSHCLFYGNDATGDSDGMGGAIYAINAGSATQIRNSVFTDNHAFGEGGAIKFSAGVQPLIDSCFFSGNNSLYGGGAISFYSTSNAKITNTVFADNYTEYSSGGAVNTLGVGNTLAFGNCVFYNNEARHGDGGAVNLAYAEAAFVNTIIYTNQGMYSDDLNLDFDGYADIYYSDASLPDGANGSNNFYSEPQFTDADNLDFTLTPHSPCIDAGTNTFTIWGDTLVNITNYYGSGADVGAYEYFPTQSVDEESPSRFTLEQNYPNPFSKGAGGSPTTIISYSIPKGTNVKLNVYNLLGEKVAVLINKREAKGKHSVVFNAENLPSGIYIYELRTNDFVQSGKMILLR